MSKWPSLIEEDRRPSWRRHNNDDVLSFGGVVYTFRDRFHLSFVSMARLHYMISIARSMDWGPRYTLFWRNAMPLVVHGSADGTVTGTHRTGIFWGHHSLDRSSCVVVLILLLH